MVEAIAWHHRPDESEVPGSCALTAVYAANLIDHAVHPAADHRPPADSAYLASLGLSHAFLEWKAHALAGTAA
jgi:hypothetical protein